MKKLVLGSAQMQQLLETPERYLATVEQLLAAERMTQAADLLRSATPRIERTGYDNWNGGTELWTVYLAVDTGDYAVLGAAREGVEEQISQRLKAVLEPFTEDWYSVKIIPRLAEAGAVVKPDTTVRRQTRVNIIDGLRIDNVIWPGKLGDIDFLARIYDLQGLPSYDSRYKDAAGDIYQHRVNTSTGKMTGSMMMPALVCLVAPMKSFCVSFARLFIRLFVPTRTRQLG
jgi:AbiJ N-terminal domain 3